MKPPLRHHEFLKDKMRRIGLARGLVLDIGSGKKFQKWLAEYEPLLKECAYRTLDNDPVTGADIIGDIHKIPLEKDSVDAVICASVLEHVADPAQAVKEFHRILKPGGQVLVSVPSIHPYHATPGKYPDYWRFFEDTLRLLFADFRALEIVKKGGYFTALFCFIPRRPSYSRALDSIASFLDRAFHTHERHTTSGYYVYAVK